MTSEFVYTVKDSAVYVTGKTFPYKDELKSLGARWNPEQKSWWFPGRTDVETIRDTLKDILRKEKEVLNELLKKNVRERRLQANQTHPMDTILYRKKSSAIRFCCEDCEVADWEEGATTCAIHGSFVRSHAYNGT